MLRGHRAAKDCQGPHAVPMQQREGAQGWQSRAEQGRWAAPPRACPCVSGEDGSGQEGGKKGRAYEAGERVRGKVKGITEPPGGRC